MDFALREELKALMQRSEGLSVSIYSPTHRAGKEVEQDPIRLANLLREAERQLVSKGLRPPEAKDLLSPAYKLIRDGEFTRHQSDGLALFISRGLFRYYRLPRHFDELAFVGNRFHLNPLLPLYEDDARFYILAASRKDLRLFECTRYGISPIEVEGMPGSMAEVPGYDDTEARLLFRSVALGGSTRGGIAMFHGHGGGIENSKSDIVNYFRRVDESLHERLQGEHAPLVFAGVEYLFPIYREVNTYPLLFKEIISGNPDGMRPEELHEEAWNLVRPHFEKAKVGAIAKFEQFLGTGLASSDMETIFHALHEGKVETLFVPEGVRLWGTYDAESGAVRVVEEEGAADEDLIDLAAFQTLSCGGSVYTIESGRVLMKPLAALFRY